MALTRMDEGTLDDWMAIAQETVPYQQQVADRVRFGLTASRRRNAEL